MYFNCIKNYRLALFFWLNFNPIILTFTILIVILVYFGCILNRYIFTAFIDILDTFWLHFTNILFVFRLYFRYILTLIWLFLNTIVIVCLNNFWSYALWVGGCVFRKLLIGHCRVCKKLFIFPHRAELTRTHLTCVFEKDTRTMFWQGEAHNFLAPAYCIDLLLQSSP